MSKTTSYQGTPFLKMHGIGNDFVILDARAHGFSLGSKAMQGIANRRTGVGCDQLLLIEPSKEADAFMRIYNADGSEVGQCGNGIRCIASLVMDEKNKNDVRLETRAGVYNCHRVPGGIAIDMGMPIFDWQSIPLSEERDTLNVGLKMGALKNPCAINVGNPHVVFFVADADEINLSALGPKIENYFLFPERINVNVAQILSKGEIRLRVWERGTGITLACGTGASATMVAAHRRGLIGRKATIHMDGGRLGVEWRDDNHIILSGAIEKSFSGVVDLPVARKKAHVA